MKASKTTRIVAGTGLAISLVGASYAAGRANTNAQAEHYTAQSSSTMTVDSDKYIDYGDARVKEAQRIQRAKVIKTFVASSPLDKFFLAYNTYDLKETKYNATLQAQYFNNKTFDDWETDKTGKPLNGYSARLMTTLGSRCLNGSVFDVANRQLTLDKYHGAAKMTPLSSNAYEVKAADSKTQSLQFQVNDGVLSPKDAYTNDTLRLYGCTTDGSVQISVETQSMNNLGQINKLAPVAVDQTLTGPATSSEISNIFRSTL